MKHNNKITNRLRKSILPVATSFLVLLLIESCSSDYLDVVPDNLPTIENAFKLRNEAEKYLFTCYSYLPKDGSIYHNTGF